MSIMKKPICILFAGPVGSSKSPIANHLSWNLGLPIFNRDAIRTEVREDTLVVEKDPEILHQITEERLGKLVKSQKSFILDSSMDRKYKEVKEGLEEYGYERFLISIDISKDFLLKLYKAKGYIESIDLVDRFIEDHQKFLEEYGEEVDIRIDDNNFLDRLNICLKAVEKYVGGK